MASTMVPTEMRKTGSRTGSSTAGAGAMGATGTTGVAAADPVNASAAALSAHEEKMDGAVRLVRFTLDIAWGGPI